MKQIFDNDLQDYRLNVDFDKLLGDWCEPLKDMLSSQLMGVLMFFVNNIYERSLNTVYPLKKDLFKAFKLCKFKDVQVVIVNCSNEFMNSKSNGLAFGNKDELINNFFDSSLITLFNKIEMKDYDGLMIDKDFTLESWAKKGVLLLNSSLTSYSSLSHTFQWYNFISFVLKKISSEKQGIIFVVIGEQPNTLYSNKINDKKHTLMRYKTFDYNVLEDINSNIEEINGKNYRIKW